MAAILEPAGDDVFTVDIRWHEPNSQGHGNKGGAPLAMDAHGSLLPAEKKIPSAANGAGFHRSSWRPPADSPRCFLLSKIEPVAATVLSNEQYVSA